MKETDTIAAIATGGTNAGISIIRISGESAIEIADSIFVSPKNKKLTDAASHTIKYGHIVFKGEILDEVLVSVFLGPNSYTAEDVCEINCHGGMIITKKILKAVLDSGARLAEPGEFTKRAFLNGRIDLTQAEAVIDIINATNSDAVKNSINQLSGLLKDKIVNLRNKIITDCAFIEAALDDPEHIDIDGFSDILYGHTDEELKEINGLIDGFDNGIILKEGISTVILGKPNAGKSTLLNRLAGTERAIVTDIPGTTRDIICETVNFDGITLKIMDTAGIRETTDTVEKMGVERAIGEAGKADLILFCIDSATETDDNDKKILNLISEKNAIILFNKSDLETKADRGEIEHLTNKRIISVSAKNNEGMDKLHDEIAEMFDCGKIGKSEDVYISNVRQLELLKEARNSLNEVIKSIDAGMSEDFFSIDMMGAYRLLGNIIGEETEDDLADNIFSKFCMGK